LDLDAKPTGVRKGFRLNLTKLQRGKEELKVRGRRGEEEDIGERVAKSFR